MEQVYLRGLFFVNGEEDRDFVIVSKRLEIWFDNSLIYKELCGNCRLCCCNHDVPIYLTPSMYVLAGRSDS